MDTLAKRPLAGRVVSGVYLERLLAGSPAKVGEKANDPAKAEFFREVGERIRAAREQKGWNRERLAQEMGVGFGSISNYERGEVALDRISQLAGVLGVDPRWLLHGDRGLQEQLAEQRELLARLAEELLREPPESGPASSSTS